MSSPTATDLPHLRRCVELAREALASGDEPFGSLLLETSRVRIEERNRVNSGDATRHPEFEIARWAAMHLTPDERRNAVVYTSGEHCAMCSAAHAWAGLGAIVYAGSAAQLTRWRHDWGLGESPVAPLTIREVAPGIHVRGPEPSLADELRELHARSAGIAG
ncbi:nucleoside deaminase [Tsukamurella sp. 8F]|uniref:nucleoside deaminase n=1 Tax=unclassified Tsukamurella TaxID=2633480 RepID=UPI0023B8E9D0|nr:MULTISPECIES: nucleoside deaminase [unclassified Tsukamurella]MDF0529551.1 nucleoside deaminase [Tsukamurella sp. 8J]MDF0585761.1 nucleoside deaminase [Tsukamurella sp. 8F]